MKDWVIPRELLQVKDDLQWTQVVFALDGESLSSWFTRLCKANCANPEYALYDIIRSNQIIEWIEMSTYIRSHFRKVMCNFINMKEITLNFRQGRSAFFGIESCLYMTNTLPRYCPKCLKSDVVPYFRVIWQIPFITVCPVHDTFLLDSCPSCTETIQYWKTELKQPLNHCFNCDENLENAHCKKPSEWNDELISLQDKLLEIFNSKAKHGQTTLNSDLFAILGSIVATKDPDLVESLLRMNAKRFQLPRDEIRFDSERMFKALRSAFMTLLDYPSLFSRQDNHPIWWKRSYGRYIERIFGKHD